MKARIVIAAGISTLVLGLGACQAMVPVLAQLGIVFGQDLMAAASVNYSPRYAREIETLLVAMAKQMSGLEFQAQLAAAGYTPPPPRWARPQAAYGDAAYGQAQYGQAQYGQGQYGDPQYGQPQYGQPQPQYGQPQPQYGQPQPQYGQDPNAYPQSQYGDNPSGSAQAPYGEPQTGSSQPQYGQPASGYGAPQYGVDANPQQPSGYPQQGQTGSANSTAQTYPENPYAYQGQTPQGAADPAQSQYPYAPGQPSQNPYAQPDATTSSGAAPDANPGADPYAPGQGQGYMATRSVAPVRVTLDVLVQRAGAAPGAPLESIDDGAVLRDGKGDPAAGDRLKFRFSASCACYVYVIGIDATGYVAQIFPDADAGFGNPVDPHRQYVLPEAGSWWGLDTQRGVEQVHVVASYVERTDIEQALATLSREARRPVSSYRGVVEVVEIPSTRGLVKVKEPATVSTPNGTTTTASTAFLGNAEDIGIVATRWFHHQ